MKGKDDENSESTIESEEEQTEEMEIECSTSYEGRDGKRKKCIDWTSFMEPTDQEKISSMQEMFPKVSIFKIRKLVTENPGFSLNDCAEELVLEVPSITQTLPEVPLTPASSSKIVPESTHSETHTQKERSNLKDILKELRNKLSDDVEKLKVDPDDALADALAYYKRPDYDPQKKLRIRYSKQAAVDTGGVLRQFYTDCITQLIHGSDGIPALFEGCDKRKLPIFNAGVVISGMVKLVGRMLAHSISQVGIGINCLSPAVYWYLATGDATKANKYAVIDDVNNVTSRSYLQKV